MMTTGRLPLYFNAEHCHPRVLGLPFAAGVTLVYLIVGSLWIFFSDRLMGFLARSPEQMVALSTGKGWFFVFTTGGLLFWLLSRLMRRIRHNHHQMRICAARHWGTLQAIGEGVLTTDGEGRLEMMNPVAESLTGWTADAASGRTLDTVFQIDCHADGLPLAQRVQALLNGDAAALTSYDCVLVSRGGQSRPVAWSASAIHDSDGSVSGLVLVFRDQTAEHAADAALRESDRELKRAQRLAHVGSWSFNLRDGSVAASDEARRIYGMAGDRASIADVQKVPLITYREMLDKALGDLISKGKPYDVEYRIRRSSDGAVRNIHSVAEYDAAQRRVVGTIHDITERKQAEAARRESECRYLELFEQAVDGIVVGSPDGRITDANASALRMLGLDKGKLCGRHMRSLFSESQLTETPLAFDKLARGETVVRERQYVRPDGKVLMIEMHSKQMPDDGYHSFFRDVTDRKRAEIERERLQAQLLQARKIESVGRLAGGVAHDFNNMLGVIMGYAEMAMRKMPSDAAINGDLKEILNAARRSADMTGQLLSFARKQPIMPDVLDLNKTIEGILNMLRRLIGEHIDLVWIPAANPWPVRMDRSQVEQILANLCLNARDAISGTGRITIETDKRILTQADCAEKSGLSPGCYVKITLTDTGCGMSKDLLDSVFEPFFTTKGVGKGTGLGLATVYGIVKQNNGYIHVSSIPEEGTTFSIYLPRSYRKIGKTPTSVRRAAVPAAGGGETILVAEDEPGLLSLCELGLSDLGYRVLTATAPAEAIAAAKGSAGRIDLLVSDIVMPEMNGKDLALTVGGYCPDIKVLYMSGYTASVIANHGVLDEGIHFIQKPFAMSTLAQKVREALDACRPISLKQGGGTLE